MIVPNLHAFEVRYLGATNSLGSRVMIKSLRFNQRVTIAYNYSFDSTYAIAIDYLTKKGYEIEAKAEGKDCYLILSKTFEPLKSPKHED
jgi:hypothetical protein